MEYGKFNGWVALFYHVILLTTLQLGHSLKYTCLAQTLTYGRDQTHGNHATINFSFVFPTTSQQIRVVKISCYNSSVSPHARTRFLIGAREFEIKCPALMTDTVVRLVLRTVPGRQVDNGVINGRVPVSKSKKTYLSCSCNHNQEPSTRYVVTLEDNSDSRNSSATDFFILTDKWIPGLEYTNLLKYIFPWCLNCLVSIHGFGFVNGELPLHLSKRKISVNTYSFNLKVEGPWHFRPNNNAFNYSTLLNGVERKKRQKRNLACQLEKFGPHCEYSCYCARSKPCHTVTGACDEYCALGWTGPSCNERACGNTDYLDIDMLHCLPCACNNSYCDILTARCHAPCGREASCIQQQCDRHFFAPPNCKRKCFCWGDSECHPVTGICSMETCNSDLYESPTCSEPQTRVSLFHVMNAMMILTVLTIAKLLVYLAIARSTRERLGEEAIVIKGTEKVKCLPSIEEGAGVSQAGVDRKDIGVFKVEEVGCGGEDDSPNEIQ